MLRAVQGSLGSREQAPADLNDALRATVTVARNQFRYVAEAELEFEDVPLVVCNIGDLNQVFQNLVVNAADAIQETGRQGTITIGTRVVEEEVVSVSDTGAGVPKHLTKQAFFTTKGVGRGTGQSLALVGVIVDRHGGSVSLDSGPGVDKVHRVEDPMVMSTSGTGLGLFIARQLTQAMHGEFTAESSLGVGSRFTLTLPLVADEEPDSRPGPSPRSQPFNNVSTTSED